MREMSLVLSHEWIRRSSGGPRRAKVQRDEDSTQDTTRHGVWVSVTVAECNLYSIKHTRRVLTVTPTGI